MLRDSMFLHRVCLSHCQSAAALTCAPLKVPMKWAMTTFLCHYMQILKSTIALKSYFLMFVYVPKGRRALRLHKKGKWTKAIVCLSCFLQFWILCNHEHNCSLTLVNMTEQLPSLMLKPSFCKSINLFFCDVGVLQERDCLQCPPTVSPNEVVQEHKLHNTKEMFHYKWKYCFKLIP